MMAVPALRRPGSAASGMPLGVDLEAPLLGGGAEDGFDLVLVIGEVGRAGAVAELKSRLNYAELDFAVLEPPAGAAVGFVAIGASEERLLAEAARVGFGVLLCEAALGEIARARGVAIGTDGRFAAPGLPLRALRRVPARAAPAPTRCATAGGGRVRGHGAGPIARVDPGRGRGRWWLRAPLVTARAAGARRGRHRRLLSPLPRGRRGRHGPRGGASAGGTRQPLVALVAPPEQRGAAPTSGRSATSGASTWPCTSYSSFFTRQHEY